jgi:hypothetical protein
MHRPGKTGALFGCQNSPYFIRGRTPYMYLLGARATQETTKLTEIDARQSTLQVIIVITISSNVIILTVFRVRKGIIVEAILLEALQKIHHRLALRSRRRWFRMDVGRQLITVKRLRALRVCLKSTHC